MPKRLDLAGGPVVVTGASSGIGAALARQLAERGAPVALVARREDRLEQLAGEIREAGGRAVVHPCDVSDREAVSRCAAQVREQLGDPAGLVNAAGVAVHALFRDHTTQDIERMMATNFHGGVWWIRELLPAMSERRRGWILNVSSFAGVLPQPDESVYCATKHALTGLSEALGYELEPIGIHVAVVHPVLVSTEMFTPEVMARMPRGSESRFISPAEFARQTLRALERRERSLVIPRAYRLAPVLRALLPGPVGRGLARAKLAALPDLESPETPEGSAAP
jgi:short-subunit dehydrogenase